jgi:hypothetical protein
MRDFFLISLLAGKSVGLLIKHFHVTNLRHGNKTHTQHLQRLNFPRRAFAMVERWMRTKCRSGSLTC